MTDICVIIVALSVWGGAEWQWHRSGNGTRLSGLVLLMRQKHWPFVRDHR
jgi:hypothetical protein